MFVGGLRLFMFIQLIQSSIAGEQNVIFHVDEPTKIDMDKTADIRMDFTCQGNSYCSQLDLDFTFLVADTNIALISGYTNQSYGIGDLVVKNATAEEYHIPNISISVRGEFIGKTALEVTLKDQDLKTWTHPIHVRRVETIWDIVFQVCLGLLLVVTQTTFGCELVMTTIKGYIKKPIGIIIGMTFQYGVLPSVAFGLGYLLQLESELAFGLLAIGCSPGGGFSNIVASVTDGDINLSIVMTFFSNIMALGMMPLWIFTAGAYILGDSVTIPILQMFLMLIFLLIIPTFVGILIKRKKPNIAEKIIRYLRPATYLLLLVLVGVGIYVNLFLLQLLAYSPWELILACAALPAVAMVFCGITTFLLRRPWRQIKTICIEVGVQNTTLPLLILRSSIEQPDADLSSVPPMLVGIAVMIYLVTATAIHFMRKRFCPNCLSKDKAQVEEKSRKSEMEGANGSPHFNSANEKTAPSPVASNKGILEHDTIQTQL